MGLVTLGCSGFRGTSIWLRIYFIFALLMGFRVPWAWRGLVALGFGVFGMGLRMAASFSRVWHMWVGCLGFLGWSGLKYGFGDGFWKGIDSPGLS